MKKNIFIFVIGFIVAFAGGYLFIGTGGDSVTESAEIENTSTAEEDQDEASEDAVVLSDEGETLSQNNCLSCHAVESIGAPGGTAGPDLSDVYNEIEDKHGMNLDEFLQEPTSGVMATVLGDNPLGDAEREQIVEVLKAAAEK